MAGNIIPAIATTNAMTASLCVLQAFKVLRADYAKARTVFLSKNLIDNALMAEPLSAPNPNCPVCGTTQARISVDLSRATLRDLVEGLLQQQLGYTSLVTVSTDAGILYDPELDDNLPRKLADMGVTQDTFLTIVDEEDDDPRVNILLAVSPSTRPEAEPAVALLEPFEIARKPKAVSPALANGDTLPNGHANGTDSHKRKRPLDEEDVEAQIVAKRGKVLEGNGVGPTAAGGVAADTIVIDDHEEGAIVLDDD